VEMAQIVGPGRAPTAVVRPVVRTGPPVGQQPGGAPAAAQPVAPVELPFGTCQVFPADNIWNTRVDTLPVDPRSNDYVASIGADAPLKPDFGAGLYEGRPMGIPFVMVPFDQPKVEVIIPPEGFAEESD